MMKIFIRECPVFFFRSNSLLSITLLGYYALDFHGETLPFPYFIRSYIDKTKKEIEPNDENILFFIRQLFLS